ncbi:SDR family oxidoreductase [Acidaminobacter sp. JC074]|uniref:SDR family oxidoreductase n=1 Tax=Acidaminobacter sp. JC074 TaxID=2530199 RepID=UPI001F0D1C3C|nr:SDR family oxidoreductase [Acidaminobacter sp. JC074]MCH4886027.1 SDR family oxidoreductase [Acidaminobacter sp. JC074]
MRLENKVAMVTGAAKGLGESIVRRYVEEGAKVIAVDMTPLTYELDNVTGYVVDVTDRQAVSDFIKDIEKVDILVNNAGITRDALVQKMTDDMWDKVIDVNLNGVYNLVKHVGPMMMKNGNGSIISIASVVGEFGNIGQSNYAATKSALYGLSKTWAKEFSRKGANVRVNTISPGYIMTDILKTIPQELLDKFAKMTMLGRLGEPEEIANAALFLASDESSYITGHNLSANGGMRL